MVELSEAFRLDGKVAVITGGGSGIGRAIAQTFASAGASVVVGDINDEWGTETCAQIARSSGTASFCHADVGSPSDYVRLVAFAVETYGHLDILCNLGGPPPPNVNIADVTDDQLETVLSTHMKSIIYGAQAAVPFMSLGTGGAIVNMSSTAADKPSAGNGLYDLAKSGVMVLTRVLALELGTRGIRVNAIAPGATLTNYTARFFTRDDGTVDEVRRESWLEEMAKLSPMGRTGLPEDQAFLALYLVSPASRFVTGQVIRANGGWSME